MEGLLVQSEFNTWMIVSTRLLLMNEAILSSHDSVVDVVYGYYSFMAFIKTEQ